MSGPYAEAAGRYRDAGWAGVLPVGNGPAEKGPPPSGHTGHAGADPSADQINEWAKTHGDRNIGLRLPEDIVGIDIDAYDDKAGGQTLAELETKLGQLPATWVSTARHDGRSGIQLYQVPEGFAARRDLSGGIELIRHEHRYAVVAPSLHPQLRDPYAWISPDGELISSGEVPKPVDMAMLPESWQRYLSEHKDHKLSLPASHEPVTIEAKLKEALADLERADTGGRHDAATRGAMSLANFVVAEWPGADEAMDALGKAFLRAVEKDRPREAPPEWQRIVDTAITKVRGRGTNVPTWSEHQRQQAEDAPRIDFEGCYIPADFWEARPEFRRVRDAAHSRGRSPDAVLGVALARIAAGTSHNVQVPAIVGAPTNLSLLTAAVGPPGSGKSSTIKIVRHLVPPRAIPPGCDGVPLGSGEGMLELLFDSVPDPADPKKTIRKQVYHNLFGGFDEGEMATVLGARSGSTLLPVLRTAFTADILGMANASQERKRIVPEGQAVLGIVLGIQPGLVGGLFDGEAAGTPQRFLWVATTAPTPEPGSRPRWPGNLTVPDFGATATKAHSQTVGTHNRLVLTMPQSVELEVATRDHQRQQHGADSLDEHTDLIRLKVAGILAVWQGRLAVSEEDWELAGTVVSASRRVRNRLREHLVARQRQEEQASAERAARRTVTVTDRTEEWRVAQVAEKLAKKVHKDPGRWAPGKLRASLSSAQREWFEEALEHATEQHWVVLHSEDTEGGTSERLFPGQSRPS